MYVPNCLICMPYSLENKQQLKKPVFSYLLSFLQDLTQSSWAAFPVLQRKGKTLCIICLHFGLSVFV